MASGVAKAPQKFFTAMLLGFALVGMVLGLALGIAAWANSAYWEEAAAFFQVLTGIGLLAVTIRLWLTEEKRDSTRFHVVVMETEPHLFQERLLRIQLDVINEGLRDSAIGDVAIRLSWNGETRGWQIGLLRDAYRPEDSSFMIQSGARRRFEVLLPGVDQIDRKKLAEADIGLRIKPVLGDVVELKCPRLGKLAIRGPGELVAE
jgi:hypothetical protein